MSDYSRVNDFSVKDALPKGDANKKIFGSEMDAELDAVVTANNSKANKVTSPTNGAYLIQDSNGDLADGGVVISSFVDTLLDDANAGAFLTTLGITAFAQTVLDDADAATARATLGAQEDVITTQGDLVRGDSSGDPERVALGTTGQIITSDGTDAAWGDRDVFETPQATTSGTAFDFTGIPSWVNKILVVLSGVSLSGTDGLVLQIGDSGGIENSGYLSNASTGTTAAALSTASFQLTNAPIATHAYNGIALLARVTGNTWALIGAFGSGATSTTVRLSAGAKTLSGTLDRVRLTRTGTDTFDAGTVNIIY